MCDWWKFSNSVVYLKNKQNRVVIDTVWKLFDETVLDFRPYITKTSGF